MKANKSFQSAPCWYLCLVNIHLYSKAFNPSCACSCELFESHRTVLCSYGWGSTWRRKIVQHRLVLCSEWAGSSHEQDKSVQSVKLLNAPSVKGESVLHNTVSRSVTMLRATHADGFGRGLAKLVEVVGGSSVSCWNESWKDQCVSQDLVDICIPDPPGSYN